MVLINPYCEQSQVRERRAKFAVGLWLRACAGAVFLGLLTPFAVLGIDFPYSKCAPAFIGLGALIGVNAIYWRMGECRGFPVGDFYVHWAVDLVLITSILYGLGGSRLPSAITAYILIVITSAVFISRGAALLVATGGAIAYSGLVAAEALGIVDPEYELQFDNLTLGLKVFVVASPVFMLYLVAFIAGTLGNDLNAANRELSTKNEQLAERNDQLDRVRNELDFHSSVLTHDIRSPVTAAIGTLARVLAGDEAIGKDVVQKLVRAALDNLYRVEDMVHTLDVVRESGEMKEECEWVNVGDVVEELQIELGAGAAQKHARIDVRSDCKAVWADRSRIVVVLRNLIANALRYVPADGEGRIEIGVVEGPGESRLFVKDNGCGVALEHQREIFEMFRKGPQGERSPGMGIGLALVSSAAKEHGGSAWVESDGASGSTFWVSLPKGTKDLTAASEVGADRER